MKKKLLVVACALVGVVLWFQLSWCKESNVKRKSNYPILDVILTRWSPRSMSGESISDRELMSLFEAARWAPSSYNLQPWRFIYARRGTESWDAIFNLMVPFNQSWAQHASALVVVISRTTFEWNNKPSRTHSFDTGAAVENLALQAHSQGLVVHAMEGFDYDAARTALSIPADFDIECMLAIGKPGSLENLPKDLQERETPSDRKPLEELAFEGTFK